MAGKKKERSSRPKTGAVYSGAKSLVFLAAPVTHTALQDWKRPTRFGDDLKWRMNAAYGVNVALVLADSIVDKAVGQNAALSRGSVTAWLPEIYWGLEGAYEFKGGAKDAAEVVHDHMVKTHQAYSPRENLTYAGPEFWTYRKLRHGGQLVRLIINRTGVGQRLMRPAKRVLGPVGLSV